MEKFGNFDKVIGYKANGESVEFDNTPEAVADFIVREGLKGDVRICTLMDTPVLNTIGIYVDRCFDSEYMEALRPVLVARQKNLAEYLKDGEGEQSGKVQDVKMSLVQSEMKKKLEKLGYESQYDEDAKKLTVSLDGERVCDVYENRLMHPNDDNDAHQKIVDIYRDVDEYVKAYENAPPLGAGVEKYRKLCEYGDRVLAAKILENGQFEFVVWSYTFDRKGVCQGDYIYDYREAKEVFAEKSGLVPKGFSQDELKKIHSALKFTRENSEELSIDEYKAMGNILERIEDKFPELAAPDESPKMGGL